MKVVRMFIAGLLAAGVLFLAGCKADPTGPTPIKNPREYKWTIDTLDYPGSLQTMMSAIWGSSSNNIYICGHNDGPAKMYRWDGQIWTNVKLHISVGGPFISLASLDGIFGLSPHDVYAVGALGPQFAPFLIHFNGSQWREITVPNGKGLLSLWGRSPSEIWIGGIDGYLSRYDGSRFIHDSLPYTFTATRMNIQVSQITGDAATTHLVLAVSPDTLFAPIFYFYERVGTQWQVRDSSYEFARIFIDPAGVVYRYGYDGVQRKTGNTWASTLRGITVGGNGMAASSANNMFVVGIAGPSPAGRVYHYNGSDWFEYTQLRLDDVSFKAVWTDGKEIFVVGTTSSFPMKTIVLHGR